MTNTTKKKFVRPIVEATCFVDDVCANKNISVYAIAKSIGMHPNQLYTYTRNRALPNLGTAMLIADALDTTVEHLWKVTINK